MTFGRFRREAGGCVKIGPLTVTRFPLQRGYFSPYLGPLFGEDSRILKRLESTDPGSHPLVCCLPHYARLAERWPGPVIYYATDLFRNYSGWKPGHIDALERSICKIATLVCPNSTRVADVLVRESGCDPNRILVLPNAVRRENLLLEPALLPGPLLADIQNMNRPVAGVIGNLAGNTDWELLEEVVRSTPWLSWVFVGPYSAIVEDANQAGARQRLLEVGGRVVFTGPKSYGDLKDYARALDVAILPYRKSEPTYSGSSTRFYEHLAACRPMVATRGFEELLHKPPALRLADTARDCVEELEQLRAVNFQDGLAEFRWKMSAENTWEVRARRMCEALMSGMGTFGFAAGSSYHA
jgi:glycosyltransferase involved in cell wall biosynthesis